MDNSKLPVWVLNNITYYGNSVIPNEIINRFGTDNIQLLLRHLLKDQSIVVESYDWHDTYPNGRMRKRTGYHARRSDR